MMMSLFGIGTVRRQFRDIPNYLIFGGHFETEKSVKSTISSPLYVLRVSAAKCVLTVKSDENRIQGQPIHYPL